MHTAKRTHCVVDGCGKPSKGKSYCLAHLKDHSRRARVPSALQGALRSSCCGAGCTVGERHDYGEQYCRHCKQPCLWKG